MNSTRLLFSLGYLWRFVFGQNLVGKYQSTSIPSNQCITKESLVLNENFFVRMFCGDAPDYKSVIEFGIWKKKDESSIAALSADSTPPHIINIGSKNTLRDGILELIKVEATPIDKAAEIFGSWKAKNSQTNDLCAIANSLEIDSNGQIRRYSCHNGHHNWFERGHFKVVNTKGSNITLSANFNGTFVPVSLQVSENNNELLVDNQVLLFRE